MLLIIFEIFAYAFLGNFGLYVGTILGNLGFENLYKILLNFEESSGSDFGCPRAPSTAKQLAFHRRVVHHRGSTFSRPSASGVGFGRQNV